MHALVARIASIWSNGSDVEPEPQARLEQIVSRQRGLKAAAIQEKLSRQETDPAAEEDPIAEEPPQPL